jgi:hypothetical protein
VALRRDDPLLSHRAPRGTSPADPTGPDGGPSPPTVTTPGSAAHPGTDPPTSRSIVLAAIGQPRPDDDEQTAALRSALRDRRYMARVAAAVDQWPALTEEQRDTVSALLKPRHRTH